MPGTEHPFQDGSNPAFYKCVITCFCVTDVMKNEVRIREKPAEFFGQ